VIRVCTDCQAPFSIEPEEEDWFRRSGLTLPKRCPRCRSARRGIKDRYLRCQRCERTFAYPREIQLYARTYGWAEPRNCIGGCPDRERGEENDEERAMRQLLEHLRDRREGAEAPPIELVLEAAPRRRPPAPAGQDPASLFRGLDGDPAAEPAGARIRDELEQSRETRTSPDDLFSSLSQPSSPSAAGGQRGKRRKRRRKRPRGGRG